MSTGLAASTVTPGSTAPLMSFTTPTMRLLATWASAFEDDRTSIPTATNPATSPLAVMDVSFSFDLTGRSLRIGAIGVSRRPRPLIGRRGALVLNPLFHHDDEVLQGFHVG